MNVVEFLKRTYLSYLSKPAARRSAYRLARESQVRTIVQLGLFDLDFLENLLWMSQTIPRGEKVRFVGIDQFEMRPENLPPLGLKDTHRQLQATGAKIKLVPGDPFSALSREANSLTGTDLLLISDVIDDESMKQAWFYVPRMLTETSVVLRHMTEAGVETLTRVGSDEIDRRSVSGYDTRRRRAA